MANSKNTVQNIPLVGTLNLNTLKTEVKPFEGYNEKNSTVFGGELGPIYSKNQTLIGTDKDNSYVFYNSKGKAFALTIDPTAASGYGTVILNKYHTDSDVAELNPETIGTGSLIYTEAIQGYPNAVWNAEYRVGTKDSRIILSIYVEGTTAYLYYKGANNYNGISTDINLKNAEWTLLDSWACHNDPVLTARAAYTSLTGHLNYNDNADLRFDLGVVAGSYGTASNNYYFTTYARGFNIEINRDVVRVYNKSDDLDKVRAYKDEVVASTKLGTIGITFYNENADSHYNLAFQVISKVGQTGVLQITSPSNTNRHAVADTDLAYLPAIYTKCFNDLSGDISSTTTVYVDNTYNTLDYHSADSRHEDITNIVCGELDSSFSKVLAYSSGNAYHYIQANRANLLISPFCYVASYGNTLPSDDSIIVSGLLSAEEKDQDPFNLGCVMTAIYPESISSNSSAANWDKSYPLYTGCDPNGVIPGVRGGLDANLNGTYSMNGLLYSKVVYGLPLTTPGTFSDSDISENILSYSYKRPTDNNYSYEVNNIWYHTYLGYYYDYRSEEYPITDVLKDLVINGRYVLLLSDKDKCLYDIETESFLPYKGLGYIYSGIVGRQLVSTSPNPFECGYKNECWKNTNITLHGSAFNTFPILGNLPFSGLIYNSVVTDVCDNKISLPIGTGGALVFKTLGNIVLHEPTLVNSRIRYPLREIQTFFTASSMAPTTAEYIGSGAINTYHTSPKFKFRDSNYMGTVYPMDSNSNIVLPYSLTSRYIRSFHNNDMISDLGRAYPILYTGVSNPRYNFTALSEMNNVIAAFSLQSMNYVVTDRLIFNVSYANGVISRCVCAAYKENMQYLGCLPTRAIFYSKYNKALYQFTGDSIISKMLDASDIDEIYYIGQNSATLSLWICTNKGIYIISNDDMFKLNYVCKYVDFSDNCTHLIQNDDSNVTLNNISLYRVFENSEIIPIKFKTCFYGIGSEKKAQYDCWYIRLHAADKRNGYLKLKVNTITDKATTTEEKEYVFEPKDYDDNDIIYIRYQSQAQSAVAVQLEGETNLSIYQLSLGTQANDAVSQVSRFNF